MAWFWSGVSVLTWSHHAATDTLALMRIRPESFLALFPTALLLGGCGQAAMFGAEYMPLAQSRTVLQSETSSKPLAGHVDSNFQPDPGREHAVAANGGYELDVVSFDAGRICVSTEGKGQYEEGVDRAERHEREHSEAYWGTEVLLFNARKNFDDLNDKSLWPENPTTQIDKVKVTEVRRSHTNTLYGPGRPGFRLTYRVDMCGPAPKTDEETKYLTITRMPKGSFTGYAPSLFVWIVDRDGSVTPSTNIDR